MYSLDTLNQCKSVKFWFGIPTLSVMRLATSGARVAQAARKALALRGGIGEPCFSILVLDLGFN